MPTPQKDREARPVLAAAYELRSLPPPSLAEMQLAQAVGRMEGGYGLGWPSSIQPPPHNWGAIQCGHKPPCGPDCFEHPDSDPDTGRYMGCFRRYPSRAAGAAALLHQLYRRPGVPEAMRAGDAHAMATAMYDTRYYRGFGPTREVRINGYAGGLERHRRELAKSMGESVASGPATTRGGSLLPWAIGAAALAAGAYYLGKR